MPDDKQIERRTQIEAAAFEVLEQVGFKKASMLQIAKICSTKLSFPIETGHSLGIIL